MRLAVLAVCLLGLAACVGGGAKAPAEAANPITGGDVTVTALTPPPGAAAATVAAPATPPTAEPAKTDSVKADPAKAEPAKAEAPVVAPPATPEEAACRKEGGSWSKVGKGGRACLKATRDNGKSCSRGTDCEGLCLARSGTCAPLKPMFGCNEIFQDDGQRVTLCID